MKKRQMKAVVLMLFLSFASALLLADDLPNRLRDHSGTIEAAEWTQLCL